MSKIHELKIQPMHFEAVKSVGNALCFVSMTEIIPVAMFSVCMNGNRKTDVPGNVYQ